MSAIVNKIEQILTSEYSVANYVELMQEIFDSMKLVAPNGFKQEFSNFSTHIVGRTHVGNYTTPDNKKIAIFSVQLKKENYVESSRSTQRSYAKKLIEGGNCDAAIVAFYTESDPKWRLSFVRLDYEMKIDQGKLKTTENITPAKRYSFLVGKDEPCHTAIDRFRQFIIDQNSNPTLDELEEAFSVEKVTKEFFDLYCEKFYQLQEFLDGNEDFVYESQKCGFTSEQFAKKLMGQIVFLYFLQKKGWLGVNVWPSIISEKEYKNIFYIGGAHGRIIKENLPKLYSQQADGSFKFNSRALDYIPDDEEEVIANHMVRNKTWGDGSKKFLRTIFEYSRKHKGHFYENYLEPLFYDTLNRNRGNMGYCPALHCRIPFLSGGLFEPLDGYDWKSNCFDIPDEIFSNKKDNNDRQADGILDIFDRYNFTMSEDEPMEREVAIDPEMLGKIFENLLEVRDRKSKGAFYTPREIVHYMCQESLINYLVRKTDLPEDDLRDFILYGDFMKDEDTVKSKREGNGGMYISAAIFKVDEEGKVIVNKLKDIDDALASVRVADPAVGSGAFPLGMVNEIVRARENITAYLAIGMNANAKRLMYKNERSPYMLKYNTIKNSIFAVDIEPSAVDIAQLRLWLSLVIDDEITPNASNELEGHRDPLPLPNLECNIVCGNSLIDRINGLKLVKESDLLGTMHEGIQLDFGQSGYDLILTKLLQAQDELFRCDDPNKKVGLKQKIQSLKDVIIEDQLAGCSEEIRNAYNQAKASASRPFTLWQLDFARVFRDNGGFDIVIGNPPYIQLQKAISETEKLGDLYSDCGFETFAKTGDIYCLFYEKGCTLLCQQGVLSYITSNKWMKAGYGKALREYLSSNTNPVSLIDFGSTKVFESATVDVNILMFTKESNKKRTLSCVIKEDCKNNMSVYVMQNGVLTEYANSESWTILSTIEQSIKKKIESIGTPLKQWDISINYGIKTGLNDAFIIDSQKRNELISQDPKSAEIIRPILRGRDIKRYSYEFADLYIITTFPSLKYDIDQFPAVKRHFLEIGMERLEQTGKTYIIDGETIKARKKTNNKWYETQDSISYWDDFSKQKIVWGNLCLSAQYTLAEENLYISAPSPIITNAGKYVLALLNSKLLDWYVRQLGVTRNGGYFEYKPMFVEKVPVPHISPEAEKPFEDIVDIILDCKKNGEPTEEYEQEIDRMVFDLFELTTEERRHVLSH